MTAQNLANRITRLLEPAFDEIDVAVRRSDKPGFFHVSVKALTSGRNQRDRLVDFLRSVSILGYSTERVVASQKKVGRGQYEVRARAEMKPFRTHLAERIKQYGHSGQERDPAYPVGDKD